MSDRSRVWAVALLACGATVGIFAAEFHATPVWPAGRETERNLFVGFRARVDARAAKLRYSASSIARVWLNGEFLAYGPARGPHGVDRIDEIDLAGRVTNGVNVLAFEVAGYNIDTFYLINEPAYLAAEVLDAKGGVLAATRAGGDAFEAFVLDERVQKVPRFSYQRPFCEAYALAPDWAAWRTGAPRTPVSLGKATGSPKWIDRVFPYPDYSVSRVFRPIRAGALVAREPQPKNVGRSVYGEDDPKRGYAEKEIAVQPVYGVRRLTRGADRPTPPAGALAFAGGDYVLLDHGLCDTGFLGARVVCTKPGRVYFHFDEVLVNGDIDVARMGWQCVNTVTYDFKAPGVYEVEAFEPNTFKYLKVMSDGFAGTVGNLYLRGYKNAAALKATFKTDDPALAKIFAAARETFAQNAVDGFMDCPSRERAGWLCDSFFSARVAKLLTGGTDVERGFLQNFALCPKTFAGGFLPMCYPADSDLLPNWNFWLILEVEEYLKRSGDRELVDLIRPKLEAVIAAFRRYRNSDGLLEKLPGWVFVEWSFANNLVQDVSYPSNMTYAEALDAMARLYGLADCAAEAKKVRETVRKQSWTGEWFCDNAVRQKDGTLKLSGECTETCQYYAFYFHVATPETHPGLWKRLVTDFGPDRKKTKKHPKIHFANAFVGNYLRLDLLYHAGLRQQVLDESKGYFLGMAEKTGTLWEHDNISNSCDHGFASHAAIWLMGLSKRPQPRMRVEKPGAVKPAGWLRDRALAARNGFTGHMDEVDEHFRLAWTTNCMRRGAHLNWIDSHKGSWSAEGGAYWFDGLVKLAFQLDDAELKSMAGRRLDAVLDNVGPNTVGFLWWYDRRKGEDVKDAFDNGSWRFWTVGMSERALAAWWAATGDRRVPRALENVFGFADMSRRFGGGMPTLLSGVYDAAQVTRSTQVEDCLAISCTNYYKNIYAKPPWRGLVDTLGIKREHTGHYNMPSRHGVGACESLLSTLRAYLWTGDEKFLKAVLDWYAFFDRHCRQPYGVTMMDEEWGWAGAKRGTETCDVAAEMFTRENLLAALGDGKWGDDVERAFFNAGPACVSRDFKRHVYFQMPNRTGEKGESGKMSCPWDSHLRYGLSVWPLCCTAALNRILPNYVQHMWLKTAEGGVAAALYGPSTFEAVLPAGRVRFAEKTAYPFDETIEIRVEAAPSAAFPLKLRLPGWCERPEVAVNGERQKIVAERGFATVRRAWKSGDVVSLRLKMAPRLEEFHDMNEQGRLRRSVVLGPLLFAYAIPTADDNTPLNAVREPLLPSVQKLSDFAVRRGVMPAVWNWPEASPLKVVAKDADGQPIELVPYGCTKLRIAAFGVR